MRRGVCAIALLGVAACGEIKGLDDELLPLARVPIVLTGELSGVTPTARRYAALLWGGVPRPDPFCDRARATDDPARRAVVDAGCPSRYYMIPKDVGPVIELSPEAEVDQSVTLPLFTTPETESSQPVFGAVVVFEDRNRTGTLELSYWESGPASGTDRILGASIVRDDPSDVVGIAFRELGPASDEACVGSACLVASCELPVGFSRAAMTVYRPEIDQPTECLATSLSKPVQVFVPLTGDPELAALRCPDALDVSGAWVDPLEGRPDASWVCESPYHLVIASPAGSVCARVQHYLLRGCWLDPYCESPEIDMTDETPAWWPCAGVTR